MARILSNLAFWLLMIPMTIVSIVFVLVVYLPFVALKAVWLGATGQLEKTTGPRATGSTAPPFHPG